MKKALICMAVLSMATLAVAQNPITEWSHDWSDNLTYLAPYNANVSNLRSYTDGNGVTGAAADYTATGYNMLWANLFESGQNLYTGQCIDMRNGQFSISLMYDAASNDPNFEAPASMGFWLRFYTGTYTPGDPDADPPTEPVWTYTGQRSNYFADVPNDGNYHTFTFDSAAPNEAANPWDLMEFVYKFRIDAVVWDGYLVPGTFGVDHVSFTAVPEPASLLVLALGMLIRRR